MLDPILVPAVYVYAVIFLAGFGSGSIMVLFALANSPRG